MQQCRWCCGLTVSRIECDPQLREVCFDCPRTKRQEANWILLLNLLPNFRCKCYTQQTFGRPPLIQILHLIYIWGVAFSYSDLFLTFLSCRYKYCSPLCVLATIVWPKCSSLFWLLMSWKETKRTTLDTCGQSSRKYTLSYDKTSPDSRNPSWGSYCELLGVHCCLTYT